MTSNYGVLVRESADAPSGGAIVPVPRCTVNVRAAVESDVEFIDSLQKMHSHMVGWLPNKQVSAYIAGGHVLVAENDAAEPLGYCIYKDQYLKRDDVGIVYQLNVLPLRQRNLIGATLVKAAFDRAAYGCKLFCCWCAQDIQANWFWESIGFVPLAFRTGSRGKQRTHIFWQRRIREGDTTTPWWFPYQTQAGAVREDRIVLPIPPDTHWRDAKPLVLPDQQVEKSEDDQPKVLPGGAPVRPRPEQPKLTAAQRATIKRSQSKHLKGVPMGKKAVVTASGIKYVDRTDFVAELDTPEELLEQVTKKASRQRKPRQKHDPKLVTQARELRDRYLEEVNERGLLPAAWEEPKYNVSRLIEGDVRVRAEEVRMLGAG